MTQNAFINTKLIIMKRLVKDEIHNEISKNTVL